MAVSSWSHVGAGRARTTHLCRHDQATGARVNGDIARHQTNISKLGSQLSELLVRQGLLV